MRIAQIIFFNVHEIHLNDHTLSYLEVQNIQPFFLKPGYSGNNHPPKNMPNKNPLYNGVKAS